MIDVSHPFLLLVLVKILLCYKLNSADFVAWSDELFLIDTHVFDKLAGSLVPP